MGNIDFAALKGQLNQPKRRKPLILDTVAPFLCWQERLETKNDYYIIRISKNMGDKFAVLTF